MAADYNIAASVRATLAGAGTVREVKMFGGIGFMLNGNMLSRALAYAALGAALSWSFTTLAIAAKNVMASVPDYLVIGSAYSRSVDHRGAAQCPRVWPPTTPGRPVSGAENRRLNSPLGARPKVLNAHAAPVQ